MHLTHKTLRVALWTAFVNSVGFLLVFPLFLGLVALEARVSSSGSAGGGALFLLVFLAFLFSRWLKKKPYFERRLTVTDDESKLFFIVSWSVAGLLFFSFILNLSWFYAHDTTRVVTGVVILWMLMFGTLFGIVPQKRSGRLQK